MFRKLYGELKNSDSDGSTSWGATRARLPVEDQAKEMERSVTRPQESSKGTSTPTSQQKPTKAMLEIDGRHVIYSIAFLMEGKHILSGGGEGNIRRWRLEDGEEVGIPMNMRGWINNMAVSRDEKWIVGGSDRGVSLWSAENRKEMSTMKGHKDGVMAVDISPDGSKIASGSWDKTVRVWVRRTSEQLLTLQHDGPVPAVKFSPDGSLLATATWNYGFAAVRVYNSDNGRPLLELPVRVGSGLNQSLAWNDDKHLYAISGNGVIHYIDVPTRQTLSQWPIRTDSAQRCGCITLSSNRKFLAASADSSISFWDTTTRTKIGPDIECNDMIMAMAISEKYNIAIGHGNIIMVRNLGDILPAEYLPDPTDIDSAEKGTPSIQSSESMTELEKSMRELENQLAILQDRYESQSQELISVKKEIDALKSSIEVKDRKTDALATEVDHWKRAEAIKTEELAAANKELEQRRRDSEELIAVSEELQLSQSQTVAVQDWYDGQYRQLKLVVGERQCTPFLVHNFISQADSYAEVNIIETLERLNESIQRSSTFIADRVTYNFQPLPASLTEEQISTTKRVASAIGQPLVNRLRSSSRTEVVAYLPIALRAYFIYHLYGVISAWSIDSGSDQLIHELYKVVRTMESQTISGRWRSLTYASLSPTCPRNLDKSIAPMIDSLSDIIVTAGCAPSTSAAREMLMSKFRYRLSLILTTTGQLTKSIMDALSADYRVEVVRPTEILDDQLMEADSVGGGIKLRTHRVLCTTQLGLSKEVITQSGTGPNKKNTLTMTNVVKVKVLLG